MHGVLQGEEVVDQQVDGDGIFSRVILPGAGQERLGEEEAGDPEGRRGTFLVPGLEKHTRFLDPVVFVCVGSVQEVARVFVK